MIRLTVSDGRSIHWGLLQKPVVRIRHIACIFWMIVNFQAPSFAQVSDSVSILSWNIQMLPGWVKSNGKMKRAQAISNKLNQASFDIVVFQELFHRRSRNLIARNLAAQYPYHTDILNRKSIALKTNGGVMIFSRFPITQVKEIRYKARKGYDRMARKGAMLAEIDVNGKSLQIAGTHLQAFGTDEILFAQYQQLANELLAPNHKAGVPQLICGDFNTLKSLPASTSLNVSQNSLTTMPRYEKMISTLQASDGELDGEQQYTMDRPFNDLCKKRKEFRLLLDYILLRSNGSTQLQVTRKVTIMRAPWHPEHQDLSDHFGLQGTLTGLWGTESSITGQQE